MPSISAAICYGTCTGEEVPDDPQISYHNILKMGFTPAYIRRNMAPPKPI